MSILCGLLKERGSVVKAAELRALAAPTRRYATGDTSSCIRSRIGMCLQPYLSHERSAGDAQPYGDVRGNMLCFDGRLDNWSELASLLELKPPAASDSHIVLAAFQKWGADCFSHLTGDWALSFWSAESETLFLARDHAGTRTLYFSRTPEGLLWATHLDTFMLNEAVHPVSTEYACCYLSSLPIRDRTPYRDIASVLPGHVVTIREDILSQSAHWTPFPKRSVRYAKTADYDQHFLELFGRAVSRRSGAGAPVLAQLSGGMDSTAIVCMSDTLRRAADPHAETLDTLSFYDDSERSLNERAFFTITERYRGKTGTHINAAFSQRSFLPYEGDKDRYLVPGADSFTFEFEQRLEEAVWSLGYRSVLSGIGGDEVTGGVPDGRPELADYLVFGRPATLLRKAFVWSLVDRSPIVATLYAMLRYTIQTYARRGSAIATPPEWLTPGSRDFVNELRLTTIPASPRPPCPPNSHGQCTVVVVGDGDDAPFVPLSVTTSRIPLSIPRQGSGRVSLQHPERRGFATGTPARAHAASTDWNCSTGDLGASPKGLSTPRAAEGAQPRVAEVDGPISGFTSRRYGSDRSKFVTDRN